MGCGNSYKMGRGADHYDDRTIEKSCCDAIKVVNVRQTLTLIDVLYTRFGKEISINEYFSCKTLAYGPPVVAFLTHFLSYTHLKISKDTSTSSWQEGFYLRSLSKGKFTGSPTKNKTELVIETHSPPDLKPRRSSYSDMQKHCALSVPV